MKLIFDELVCLIVLVVVLSSITCFVPSIISVNRINIVELIGFQNYNNGTLIILRNCGAYLIRICKIIVDNKAFNVSPALVLKPWDIQDLQFRDHIQHVNLMLVFFDDGSFYRVV